MGAFGVALEVKKRVRAGLLEKTRFDLEQLSRREVSYGKSFICRGAKNHCDRRCQVAVIIVDGKKYPFGGACNRYENLRRKLKFDTEKLDRVQARQRIVFEGEKASAQDGVWKSAKGPWASPAPFRSTPTILSSVLLRKPGV